MADSVIAAQARNYGLERVVQPYLLQTEDKVNIPDYWNDERYSGTTAWEKANEPRFGNETAWVESSPHGYKEAEIMDNTVIANQEASWGYSNTNMPYYVQGEADIRNGDAESSSESYSSDDEKHFVNAAQISHKRRTYPEWDSESYISPYSQRDHAWTNNGEIGWLQPVDQYDVSNETHWVDTSAVDGYKIPITADDGDQFFAQKEHRTYPEWDSQSYISPYSQRDHAWTNNGEIGWLQPVDQYDVSNETHWVDTSAVDGYKIPITADDGDQFFAQKEHRTYPEWDSQSYISPYSQRDHAWTNNGEIGWLQPTDQYDMSNETHWVDTSAVDGYKIPITADDDDQFFAQRPNVLSQSSKGLTRDQLAKVAYIQVGARGDYNWLCDVKGEDGKPFYIHNYDEYYHCAVIGRVNTNDILDEAPVSFAQSAVSKQALAQVATMTRDYNWLCDVRGDDGRPFYVASYAEYAHCAEMFRVNADDNLEEAPGSFAQYPVTGTVVDDLGVPISDYREHAWNDEQYWASNEGTWQEGAPAGYDDTAPAAGGGK